MSVDPPLSGSAPGVADETAAASSVEGRLPASTTTFLRDLERAADAATLEHDRTLLVLRTVGALSISGREAGPHTIDGVIRPTKRQAYHQIHRASLDHHAALEELREVTHWYCDAAEAVLGSVVAGRPVPTVAELSGLAPGSSTVEHRTSSEPRARPVPDLDTLLSGIPMVDGKLRAAHEALVAQPSSPPGALRLWARAVSTEAHRAAFLSTADPDEPQWFADH